MALTYTDDIEDDNIQHLRPKYSVKKGDIAKDFEKQIFDWLKKEH